MAGIIDLVLDQMRRGRTSDIAERYAAGELDPRTALLEYAKLTGDPSVLGGIIEKDRQRAALAEFSGGGQPQAQPTAAPNPLQQYQAMQGGGDSMPDQAIPQALPGMGAHTGDRMAGNSPMVAQGAPQPRANPLGRYAALVSSGLMTAEQAVSAANSEQKLPYDIQKAAIEADKAQNPDVYKKKEELGKAQAEAEANLPKLQDSFNTYMQKTNMVLEKIKEAKQKAGWGETGLAGQLMSNVGGTNAKDLRTILDTIGANIGFDELQQMRANSPTGGALGNVSDTENKLLQSVKGSIDQAQSNDQFKKSITDVEKQIMASRDRIKEAYARDIKRITGQDVAPQKTETPTTDYSSMSNEQLLALYKQQRGQ